jgi:hypothetical protein
MYIPKTARRLLGLFLVFIPSIFYAQNGCEGCIISVPEDLPADTIFLAPAPAGKAGAFYEGDLSFRVPQSTTPVAATDPDVPPGIPISKFTIETVSNLPPGLIWEASQLEFDLPDETDGCVRFCGTPLAPGLYVVEVNVTARVLIVDQPSSFQFPLLIEPAQSVTEGFTVINNIGCGVVEASFSNNVPSGGADGFSYLWDFGNGNISLEENPPAQVYDEPGAFPVTYRAIVDTTGYFMTEVQVEEVTCNDPFGGAPDLQLKVYDSEGAEIYSSEVFRNVRPPFSFNLNLEIGSGNYTFAILDDDDGILGGDKTCGTFDFNRETTGTLHDTEASASIIMVHPVDTIESVDTVTVFAQPDKPVLDLEPGPYCQGGAVALSTSYDERIQWYRDSLPLPDGRDPEVAAAEDGAYWVTYTSEDGCLAVSDTVPVAFSPLPPAPALQLENNLLTLQDSMALPEDISLDWSLDGLPLGEADGFALCIQESGSYAVQVTDNDTGCSNSSTLDAIYDPAFPGCVSDVDAFDRLVEAVTLFPNPTSGAFTLRVMLPDAQDAMITIFNAQGQQIQNARRSLGMGATDWEMNIGSLPAGFYWLQLQVGEGHRGFRILKN